MYIEVAELRRLIREEFMRGVPEFMIRQAADECANRMRQHVKKFVQQRAQNPAHARDMLGVANSTLEELSDEIYETIMERMWAFVQQV